MRQRKPGNELKGSTEGFLQFPEDAVALPRLRGCQSPCVDLVIVNRHEKAKQDLLSLHTPLMPPSYQENKALEMSFLSSREA